ncbi:MAG: PhzF family phenazine biosynthesis protein [Dehalococcoidia bacterium]
MREYAVKIVDAFATEPLAGNPAAVISEARGLDKATMQRIARQLNLSETTFVFPASEPGADYHIRFFTPGQELALAGHPTIATLHTLLEEGRFADRGDEFTVHQQTGVGVLPVEVRRNGDHPVLLMTQAEATLEDAETSPEELAAALGIEPSSLLDTPIQRVNVGIPWLIAGIRDLATISTMQFDLGALARIEVREGMGITMFTPAAAAPECSVRARSFAPADGIPEDPVCGSGNGCVGIYIAAHKLLDGKREYVSEQGIEIGRNGRVTVRVLERGGRFTPQVGGQAVTVIEGVLRLPEAA